MAGLYSSPLTFFLYDSSPRATIAMAYAGVAFGGTILEVGGFAAAGIWDAGIGLSTKYLPFKGDHSRRHGIEAKLVVFPDDYAPRTIVQLNVGYTIDFVKK